jgi:type IV pilus assembly protein PilX
MNATRPRASKPLAPRQRGVVLFIALIVLVAMTLAGLALFRQAGTGVIIAGNLAFKQNATSVGDMGIEAARVWLVPPSANPLDSDLGPGYCSSWQPGFNAVTYNWTGGFNCNGNSGSQLVTSDDGTGNEVRYVIHRLCNVPNLAINGMGQQCVTIGGSATKGGGAAAGAGASQGGIAYGLRPLTNTIQPYYRVTVRVAGPRNTVSYVQSIMY